MARERGAAALAAVTSTGAQASAATQRMRVPTNGPHDAEELDAQFVPAPGTVDFGAVKVPIPADGSVVVEPSAAGRMQAVHVSVPEGRLSVSALASPRNGGLWPDLATEIDASLREGGARVRSFTGEWGRELHATTNGATSVFVGVDGSRWMLYGVATGPTRDAVALDARLRRMLRGTVVVRGKAPYPVRTVLPLTATSQLDGDAQGVPSAAPTMMLRAPAPNGAAPNGAGTNGAGTNGAGTNVVAKTGGSQLALPGGAKTNGVSQAPAAASAHGLGRIPPHPAASYGAWVKGAAPERAAPTGAPGLGAGPYSTGTNGVNGHRPATNGVAPDNAGPGNYPSGAVVNGAHSNGAVVNGAHSTGAPVNGPTPTGRGAYQDDPSVGGAAAPYGAAFNQAPASSTPTNGRALAPRPTSTGGTPPRGVPAGWAHDTGNQRRGSSAAGPSSAPFSAPEPAPTTAIPELAGPSERPWELSAPAPLPAWANAEPAPMTQPAATRHFADRAPVPVEPIQERRSSWADPDEPRGAESAAASSPSDWDPLSDPLPGGLDPLPEPVQTWSDAVAAPSRRWSTEAVGVDALPDAGTPLFDAASAFSLRAVEQPDAGTPSSDVASSSGRSRPAPPDVGTPLFDATSASGSSHQSVDPAERAAHSDLGTPLFDAASGSSRRSAERNGHAASSSRVGYAAAEPSGRRRRDPGAPPQAYGTSRLDLPRRTRRHSEPSDEPLSAVAPSVGPPSHEAADDHRHGRRRATETPTTSTGRHDAGATSVRHRDDGPSRHADADNRHAARTGASPRVPPTQWAWPKEELPSDGSPHMAPSGRRAADPESTSWSAAELLDARNDGGRRRRGEAARHGHPGDQEAGRHHRP